MDKFHQITRVNITLTKHFRENISHENFQKCYSRENKSVKFREFWPREN